MKHFFFVLISCLFLFACKTGDEAASRKIVGNPTSEQVRSAIDNFQSNQKIEAMVDTTLGIVSCKLFEPPCKDSVIAYTTYSSRTGDALEERAVKITVCTGITKQYYAGYVYIPYMDQKTNRNIWVPCPALLKENKDHTMEEEPKEFTVREIYTTSDGYEKTKLLVEN